ncbi:MAG: FmdB family zinc ribbon protein [Burkholderiales bacterium]
MPTYEYRCNDCGHEFERVEHLSEHEAKHECPACGSRNTEPVMAEFFPKTSRKS